MESSRGVLISRVFRIRNLMDAKVHYGPSDLSVEEARVLELIELERPSPQMPGKE
jgi:hypothetical protein